ncbi:hypothetical protein RchiOBHm_Chr5g0009851 [Rosa chinensis]|uniref:Uncharacterized protein n=1 Tax=Rosa chinensis TaxID=74649 RepID=A0A2P6Q4G1_ROSCH|nr:hypothetical protein RchiOBHm_Chr5g0009851 [Rosa chinensis]
MVDSNTSSTKEKVPKDISKPLVLLLFPILTTVPILGECPKAYWGTIENNRSRMMWLPVLSFCVGTKRA